MKRVKKSVQEKRSFKYDARISGVYGYSFTLLEDLTDICKCYREGAKGVVTRLFNNGTAKVCFECLHTDILPTSCLRISKLKRRVSRRPIRPARPVFLDGLVPFSRLIKKPVSKLLPKKKFSRLIPK